MRSVDYYRSDTGSGAYGEDNLECYLENPLQRDSPTLGRDVGSSSPGRDQMTIKDR